MNEGSKYGSVDILFEGTWASIPRGLRETADELFTSQKGFKSLVYRVTHTALKAKCFKGLSVPIKFGGEVHSIKRWAYAGYLSLLGDKEQPVSSLKDAHLVCSKSTAGHDMHMIALDIDLPLAVTRSRNGNWHLYIAKLMHKNDYFNLLRDLAKYGIIEQRYVEHSMKKGGTCLRIDHMSLPAVEDYE